MGFQGLLVILRLELVIAWDSVALMSPFIRVDAEDRVERRQVRYRTVGDMTCTAAVESSAFAIDDIIREITATRTSERGETRIDDKVSEAAMEDRKKNGYF